MHFEKVATNLRWSPELHTMLLQSVLVGKAWEVYLALSVEHDLKAYELVPHRLTANNFVNQ